MQFSSLIFVLGATAVHAAASASLVPVSYSRSVDGFTIGATGPQSTPWTTEPFVPASSTSDGIFVYTEDGTSSFPSPGSSIRAAAALSSSITPTNVGVIATVNLDTPTGLSSLTTGGGYARIRLLYVFDILTPTGFSLSAFGGPNTDVTAVYDRSGIPVDSVGILQLRVSGGPTLLASASQNFVFAPNSPFLRPWSNMNESGVLAPGRYELSLVLPAADNFSNTQTYVASFENRMNFQFNVPAAGLSGFAVACAPLAFRRSRREHPDA